MGFGGGSQQSATSSDAASWAKNFFESASANFANSDQMSRSNQFNAGDTMSQSGGQSSTFVDPTQQPYLSGLYQQGRQYTNPAQATAAARGLVGQTMPSLQAGMRSATALTDPRAQVAAQAASLKRGLGDLFAKEINPSISSDAIAAGGFGGGRQGVAQGVAAGELADTYASSYGDIVANANQQALQAAQGLGGMAQNIYNLGMSPTQAGLGVLQQYAGLLGGPTVLSQSVQDALSRGTTRGGGSSVSSGTSRAGGSSTSRGGGQQRSASAMRSQSSGWDFKSWL